MELKGVDFEQIGQWDFKFSFDHMALDDILIEFSKVPEDKRLGVARQFLTASLTWCTAVWFYPLLSSRGVEIRDLHSSSRVHMGKGESGRSVVESIDLDVMVDVPEKYFEEYERCRKILERDCLISRSLEKGIEVNHTISRK